MPLLKWRLPKYLVFNILPLLYPRCTIPHVKEPITTFDQISFTSKIFCIYAQYGKSNPSTPTHVSDTRKTNAKTATNARFQIDSVWGLHKVMKWKLVASTPVAQKSNSSHLSDV